MSPAPPVINVVAMTLLSDALRRPGRPRTTLLFSAKIPLVNRRSSSTARAARAIAIVIVFGISGGCSADSPEVVLPPAGELNEPTFRSVPDDLAESFQLGAIVERNTAGLLPTSPSANGAQLAEALQALANLPDPPAELTRLTIRADDVSFTFFENGITGRAVSGYYPDNQGEVTLGEPSFSDADAYPISVIDVDVPQRLIDAVEQRFPQTRVTSLDLDVDLSYDFGLVWYVEVDDAQGRFATIFADVDGAIVAVDQT